MKETKRIEKKIVLGAIIIMLLAMLKPMHVSGGAAAEVADAYETHYNQLAELDSLF